MVVKTVFFVSRGHYWRNNFLFHKIFKTFIVFRLWGKHFGFLAKIILLGCRNCFQVSRGYFWKNLLNFFLKTNRLNCFSIFGLLAQFFWNSSENFAIGLSKLHSMCPMEIFDWTVFFTKIYESFDRLRAVRKLFWHFGAKASKSLSKVQFICTKNSKRIRTFGRFNKAALYLSEWDFWLSYFLINFLSFVNVFRVWSDNSTTLAQELQRSCQKCIILEQQNFSRKVLFLKRIFTFTNFSSFDQKLCGHLSESVPPDLKNCFLHPFRGSFCITISFSSRKLTPTNGLWGKMFGIS